MTCKKQENSSILKAVSVWDFFEIPAVVFELSAVFGLVDKREEGQILTLTETCMVVALEGSWELIFSSFSEWVYFSDKIWIRQIN